MRDVETTIGGLMDKQRTAYLSSVDEAGYPNTKAMLAPREREGGVGSVFHDQSFVAAGGAVRRQSPSVRLLCRHPLLPRRDAAWRG